MKTSCVSIKVLKEDVSTNIKIPILKAHCIKNIMLWLKINHESFSSDGLECALWPILYMKDVLSDTNNNKNIKLHSFKSCFTVKLSSCVTDYSHCLLQFIFLAL